MAPALSLPNALSALRLVLAPVLILLALHGHPTAVAAVLAASFATDALDGYLARRLGQTSALGAKLDSLGDFAIYASVPLCAWWALPEVFVRNLPFFAVGLASVVLPPLAGWLRFRRTTSYHTWLVKFAAVVMGASVVVLFAGGPEWPFRAAVPVVLLASLEEIAITMTLRAPRTNVRSLWHVLRTR